MVLLRAVLVATLTLSLGACKSDGEKEEEESDVDRSSLTNCKLPVADGRGGVAIGFPRYPDRLKASGTVVATVIMVDFPDSPATMSPEDAFAKISGASETFTEMSYGKLSYTLTPTFKWYRMSKNSTEYKFNTYQTHFDYIQEALDLAEADVDFSSTDSLVVLSNPATTGLGEAGPAFQASPGDGVSADGREMLNAVTSAHDLNTWGSIWLNHEVTHNLGLVDLYAYDREDASNSYDLLRYIGEYSYMGFNSFTANAPGLTAWERWVLGWVSDSQMTCANPYRDGEVTAKLTPVSTISGTKAVVIPLSETKAAVVELRRAEGIDEKIVKPGVLVYTVDSSLASGKGAIRVYPASSDDPRFLQSTRAAGESVSVEGLNITVVSSEEDGDTVSVTVE